MWLLSFYCSLLDTFTSLVLLVAPLRSLWPVDIYAVEEVTIWCLQVKGLLKEELALRPEQVKALAAKIDAIPDGVTINNRRGQKGAGSIREIKIDAVNPGTSCRMCSAIGRRIIAVSH